MSNQTIFDILDSIESLLSMQDAQFIDCAYLIILKREPDIGGLNYYLERLGAGVSKTKILSQLLKSKEARSNGTSIQKFRLAINLYMLVRHPLLKHFAKGVPKLNLNAQRADKLTNSVVKSIHEKINKNSDSCTLQKEVEQLNNGLTGDATQMVLDSSLKDILMNPSSEVFWAGEQPPFGWMKSSSRIFDPKFDYRLPADFHQRFDLVYLTERDLGLIKAWPLVIDESLRLLAPNGKLVIRFSNTSMLSVFDLKKQIACWPGVKMDFEHTYNIGPCLFSVKNTNTERRSMTLKGFSFGVITDGKRPELLRAFVESIQEIKKTQDVLVEIIICGPDSVKLELETLYSEFVFVLQPEEFQAQGWVTKKKNLIVQKALYENIVIAHDRYIIKPDFIENLRKFGGDYSVLVCRQIQLDGRRAPDWVTLGSDWVLTPPAVLEYGDWTRYVFINGGIIIAKTEILRTIGWNELLFWGQAEDVELSHRLREVGHVPRLARNVEVITATMRKGLMGGFEAMPMLPNKFLLPGSINQNSEFINPVVETNKKFNFGEPCSTALALAGIYTDSSWDWIADAITLSPGIFGEITFKLSGNVATNRKLLIKTGEVESIPKILVNDIDANVTRISKDELLVELPSDAFVVNNIARLHVRIEKEKFSLKNFVLQPPTNSLQNWTTELMSFCTNGSGIASLGTGWSDPEYWGCWLNGDKAEVNFNYHRSTCSDLVVSGFAKAFVRPPALTTIIGVLVNGIPLSNFLLNANFEDQPFQFIIPNEIVSENGSIEIAFVPKDPCSPLDIGMNQDTRLLSMGLVSLAVSEKS